MENVLLISSSRHHQVTDISFDLKMGFASSRVWTWPDPLWFQLCVDVIKWSITCAWQPFSTSACGFLAWLAGWLAWLTASQWYTGKHEVFSFAEMAAEVAAACLFLRFYCRLCGSQEQIDESQPMVLLYTLLSTWVGLVLRLAKLKKTCSKVLWLTL